MDQAVIATAHELLAARHFPGVVAMCGDALDHEPDCIELLVIRARAHIGLRRDVEAQADLRDIIRLEPRCSVAYRLLGELAARRDENESAAIFFREALRLDPSDQTAADWLQIVCATLRPYRPVPTLRARAPRVPVERARTATDAARSLSSPARSARPGGQARFARGTCPPDEEPTVRFARGSTSDAAAWNTPTPTPIPQRAPQLTPATPMPLPLPPPPNAFAPVRTVTVDLEPARSAPVFVSTAPPRAPTPTPVTQSARPPTAPPRARTVPPPSHVAPRGSRAVTRLPIPELPGFGDYLVTEGILTRERLRAAQAYQRSMKVQLSTAIVTLGLATPQRVEWASVAHQSQLARDR